MYEIQIQTFPVGNGRQQKTLLVLGTTKSQIDVLYIIHTVLVHIYIYILKLKAMKLKYSQVRAT